MRCEACGAQAAAGQRFCGSCGAPLGTVVPAQRERRLVSVLFCDLVGFTTFSESRDAEDVRDVLDHYFAAAQRVVADYGGTIEKFIGDAVMALWGAPLAREDDAERSVRAGLDLVRAVSALALRLAIPELRVRVGVVTGETAVQLGAVQQGIVTGDAVNTAARLQSIAEPGTVLVDDMTRLACERVLAFEPGGAHALKGKSVPVQTWRAIGLLGDLARRARGGVVEPPFVGREPELEGASSALGSLRGRAAGLRIVSIVGDAGIGKSRLGSELELLARRSAPARWYRGRSVGFGEGTGLSALAEIARAVLGIGHNDPPEEQRALVDRVAGERFAHDGDERARVARALHRLLDLDDRHQLIEQGELFSAWRALFERLAAEGPIALVFEELQLADQALFDFVGHLRDWAPAAPILIVVLSRPDPRLDALVGSADQIELAPLTAPEMDALVTGTVDQAPEPLLAAVRAEGGGIPLYAVETLRALADRGVLAVEGSRYVVREALGEVSIPPTIRALISSRLDRLDPLERQIVTAGAVLGENFSAAAVAAVAGMAEDVALGLLDELVAKALLGLEHDQASPLRERFGFLQGVVRRVALAGLSRRERKRAHLAAVDFLSEQDEPEPELDSLLASHLLAAAEADPQGDDADSIRRRARAKLVAAAERAAALGVATEALSLFDRAAELSADDDARAEIFERAGEVAYRAGESDAAVERYRLAAEIHAAAGRERQRLRLRARELRALAYVRPAADLLPALREVWAELGQERDAAGALAGNVLAFSLYQTGDHEEALAVATAAAAIAEDCGDLGELAHALSGQASALQELERPQEAVAVQTRAVPLAERHDPRRLAPLLGNLAVSLISLGRYQEAADRARASIVAAQRGAGRLFERYGRLVLGRALCSLGDWDEAIAEIEAVRADVPPYYVGMTVAPLVVIALARGNAGDVQALIAEHADRCGDDPDSPSEVDVRLLRAAVLVGDGPGAAAELAGLIADANVGDFTEWPGWLAPTVDRLVAAGEPGPLERALAALGQSGTMRRMPPVVVQASRLEAHLAMVAGEDSRAARCLADARQLADAHGMAFEHAVLTLESATHAVQTTGDVDEIALATARTTFERLRATPWLARAEQVLARPT